MGDLDGSQVNASQSNSIPLDPVLTAQYQRQAESLSFSHIPHDGSEPGGMAVKAEFVTPHDPIIITADGGRLPGVPVAEAEKLNKLHAQVHGEPEDSIDLGPYEDHHTERLAKKPESRDKATIQRSGEGSLRKAMPPSRTNPLFPPLPLYGPSSLTRDLQCLTFRTTSFFLSVTFLGIVVLGSLFTSIRPICNYIWLRLTFREPNQKRPFHEEEKRRKRIRKEADRAWKQKSARRKNAVRLEDNEIEAGDHDGFIPTEGGPDPLIVDVGYYARRVGLDSEEYKVQTEDGFIITMWHIYNPLEYTPKSAAERAALGPEVFSQSPTGTQFTTQQPKFPILMIHGLLQSAGAYCTNDDDSLAFYLCKAGYDVWLGNNRCGFTPEHSTLNPSDPRMWAWNIRQMGVMDLTALTSRVLSETGFEKLGLICHSQGTTQTFVALAKEQRPDLGEKLTVFCALAPAAYAGPLLGKVYFKFMRLISPAWFRLIFGIHAFIPMMMTVHHYCPGKLYGFMGYRVFSFLFNWSDTRWDRGLRDRLFQFAPVYVSAESMRWWLGRECFAKQKCILATREDIRMEDEEDEMEDYYKNMPSYEMENDRDDSPLLKRHERRPKGSTAWYNAQVPPFALWVAGSDDLVDGRKLLRRFERGREPHVRVVHSKVIEEYEHLDVIWAMDSIEKVGREVKEVLWQTCNVRDKVRMPRGCENVEPWIDDRGLVQEAAGGAAMDTQSSSDETWRI